jgi:hypothetical protein
VFCGRQIPEFARVRRKVIEFRIAEFIEFNELPVAETHGGSGCPLRTVIVRIVPE